MAACSTVLRKGARRSSIAALRRDGFIHTSVPVKPTARQTGSQDAYHIALIAVRFVATTPIMRVTFERMLLDPVIHFAPLHFD
jgi:hypothetical protein